MASAFTLKTDAYQGRYMQVSLSQTKKISENLSEVKYVISSIGGESNYYGTGPTTVTVGGVPIYHRERVNWDAKVFPAAKGSVEGTIKIEHEAEGNKSVEVVISTAIYYGTVKTYKGTWELDSIPRGATILFAPNFTDQQLPTITYSNPAGNDVTSIELCIADTASWYTYAPYRAINKTGTLQYTFTADDVEGLKNRTTDKELKLRFQIRTVIGGATLYDYVERTFTMTENADTKPHASIDVTLVNPDLPARFANMCIQGKTRLAVSVSAEAKYGAKIVSYTVTADRKNYSGENVTTDVMVSSGTVNVGCTVIDSRGFSFKASVPYRVEAYSKPLVVPLDGENAILCYRSDGNGTRVANSTSVWIKAKRLYHSLGWQNGCTLQWRRKLTTEPWNDSVHSWQPLIYAVETATDEYNALLAGVVFDVKKSYDVQIMAIDDIGEYDIRPLEVPTQDVALHLGKGGKNVSVGTYCDYSREYTFYSDWVGVFDKGIEGAHNNQYATDVLEFAMQCPMGLTPFMTGLSSTNLPTAGDGSYQYATGIVHKRSENQINVYLTNYFTGAIAVNVYYYAEGYQWSGWGGWKYLTPQ